MLNIQKIQESKHILLKTDNDSFANASALYSYILTLHKKVSLYSEEKIEHRFSFLPWSDKVKLVEASSADLVLQVDMQAMDYFSFYKNNNVKINKKMATALYSALLVEYDSFSSFESNGIVFATAATLIELGAEYRLAQEEITKSDSLALFRLKAIFYKNMLLRGGASVLELYICDADFDATGACMKDAKKIMRESLSLVHVKKVILKKSDENMKILEVLEESKRGK